MIKEQGFVSIRRILDDLTEHPLLRDLNIDQVVRYTVRFIQINGYVKMYEQKIGEVDIKDYRGELPCDLVSIDQVKDECTGICLRAMTDNFPKGMESEDNRGRKIRTEGAFKTQGRVIYTSFEKGRVEIAYKAIRVDEDGFPMLIDNENYIDALEAYVKMQVFTIKFDTGAINMNVLQNAQQDYAWKVRRMGSEFTTPSVSEMETLTRILNTSILSMRHFDRGFGNLGNREYLRKH